MSYDLDLLQVRRKKREVLGQIADRDWLALVDHDPDHAGGRIIRDPKAGFRVREAYVSL
jgi:hypothetical protein